MMEIEYQVIREQIIETSFYITKFTGTKEWYKVEKYRQELNRLVDILMNKNNK